MPARRVQLRTSLSTNSNILLKPPSHAFEVLPLDVGVVRVDDAASRDQDQVRRHRPGRSSSSEYLSQQPLRAVSLDRAADFPTGDEGYAQILSFGRENERHEERTHPPPPLPIHALEVRPPPERGGSWALSSGAALRQTERRWRPLRRLRARTARPALDRILTRKPWVRLRRRRFGWNVLFISL